MGASIGGHLAQETAQALRQGGEGKGALDEASSNVEDIRLEGKAADRLGSQAGLPGSRLPAQDPDAAGSVRPPGENPTHPFQLGLPPDEHPIGPFCLLWEIPDGPGRRDRA
jgi:hypothetical protein